jgi:hypothetical protein
MSQEAARLWESRGGAPWKKWGPYLSERQWGTVREDYSDDGDAWNYLTHDQARSRAYAWGEDGIAGVSDDQQILCFGLALWNGADPIIKERLFGLSHGEGNHGEDCKEYYYYVDATPTYSYMKYLYKYPQAAYPYDELVRVNRQRTRADLEYELTDTGVFDDCRYFDVEVEYAKESPEELCIRITAYNRGPYRATLHLLPTLWYRNTWQGHPDASKPQLRELRSDAGTVVVGSHASLGDTYLSSDRHCPPLFTDNETNSERLFGVPNATPYVKDSINDHVVRGLAVTNPGRVGTKVAFHERLMIAPHTSETIRLRLGRKGPVARLARGDGASEDEPFGRAFDALIEQRRHEADEFYAAMTPPGTSEDAANVMRQAFAGMLWTMQFYCFPMGRWMTQARPDRAVDVHRKPTRNAAWMHFESADIISMPDKWEYPWFAAWDLAFHAVTLAAVDAELAKDQLRLITHRYAHPNGQIPACEWNFSDVTPPVHAGAAWQVYLLDKAITGRGDVTFLRSVFHSLLSNFTWWINRTDRNGQSAFDGGLIGLDSVGIFDRGAPLRAGGYLEQADGTAWMAVYALDMLTMALELAFHDRVYEEDAIRFYEHFIYIAHAMTRCCDTGDEMWDESDGFFYSVLRMPDGRAMRFRVRSMAGLLPVFASAIFSPEVYGKLPSLVDRIHRFNRAHPELLAHITPPSEPGVDGRRILSIVSGDRLRRILERMLDESEFLSPYGIRSLSRVHAAQPYIIEVDGEVCRVAYEPAESMSGTFGGNTNWRGPIWLPLNALIIQGLAKAHSFYGSGLRVECPTGSGREMTLIEVARELQRRVLGIFLRDTTGRRPVYGGNEIMQTDPHWRDLILFHEYFHGDLGAGLGASHQTGWTGLVARFVQTLAPADAEAPPVLRRYTELLAQFVGPEGEADQEGAGELLSTTGPR